MARLQPRERPTRARAYAQEKDEGDFDAYGVMVFAIHGRQISGIVGFPRQPELFTRSGLPTELEP